MRVKHWIVGGIFAAFLSMPVVIIATKGAAQAEQGGYVTPTLPPGVAPCHWEQYYPPVHAGSSVLFYAVVRSHMACEGT